MPHYSQPPILLRDVFEDVSQVVALLERNAPYTPLGGWYRPDAELDKATATVGTPVGEVRSSWKKDGEGGYRFEVEIPEGTKATFALPQGVPGIAIGDERLKRGLPLAGGGSTVTIAGDGEVNTTPLTSC